MEIFLINKNFIKILNTLLKKKYKISLLFLKEVIKMYRIYNFNKLIYPYSRKKKYKFSFKLRKIKWRVYKRRRKKFFKKKIIRLFRKFYRKIYKNRFFFNRNLKKKLKKKIFIKLKKKKLIIKVTRRPYKSRWFKKKKFFFKKYFKKVKIKLNLKLFKSQVKRLMVRRKKKMLISSRKKRIKYLNFFLIKKKQINFSFKPLLKRWSLRLKQIEMNIYKHFTFWPKLKKHFFFWIRVNRILKNSLKNVRLLCRGFCKKLRKLKKNENINLITHFKRRLKKKLNLKYKKKLRKKRRKIFPERLHKPLIRLFWKSQLMWKRFFSEKLHWTTKKFKYKFNFWYKKTQKISKFINWRKNLLSKDQLWFFLIKFGFFLSKKDCNLAYETGLILLNGNVVNIKSHRFLQLGDIVSLHLNIFKFKKVIVKKKKAIKKSIKKSQYFYYKNRQIWWKKPKKNPHPDLLTLFSSHKKIPTWIEFDELTCTFAFIKKPKVFIDAKTVSLRHSLEKLNTFKLNV